MARSAVERLFTNAGVSTEEMRLAFVNAARDGIRDFQARQPEPIPYLIEVNGSVVSSEFSVPLSSINRISYILQRLPEVGKYALGIAKAISPQGPTGRYKNAWFLLADNVETSPVRIPYNVREIMLVNDEPYARKLNVRGARLQGVPPGIVEKVRQFVLRKYGGFATANIEFHTLRGGYILKRNTRRHRAGEQMTYPSLVIRSRV